MDVLADLLARARAQGAVFARTTVGPDRGIAFGGRRLLAIHTVLSGQVWFERDTSLHAETGDIVLVPAGAPYRAVPAPGAPTDPLIHAPPAPAPRAAAPAHAASLLCGAYTLDALLSDAILAPLPPLIVLRDARLDRVTALLAEELSRPGPGEQTILDRALDLLLVLGLRAYFTQPGASVPGWYAALDAPCL